MVSPERERERLRMRHPVPGVRGGGLFVSELQRARLLDATFAVVAEVGYRGMAVRAVAERAGVSSKTFYDLFSDREDCFLTAFDHGVEQLAARARPAFERERGWAARIRAGLGVLLEVLEGEPALRRLVFVEALGAGPRVLMRRAGVLGQLAGVIDEGRVGVEGADGLPALMAEGVVGGAFGVIHARLFQEPRKPLVELLGPLMAMIVRPYRGRAAATRELKSASGRRGASRSKSNGPAHPAWRATHASDRLSPNGGGRRDASPVAALRPLGSGPPVDFRLTVRTQRVLAAVQALGGRGLHPNNHRVSELAGISDQGQISRLMMRLSEQGLVENLGGWGQGSPKAWRLTPDGEAVVQANRSLVDRGGQAGPALRLTERTCGVLVAVGEFGERGFAPSNREVADATGVRTAGQIAKLLARLERHGLLQNTAAHATGANAWRLTARGEEIVHASQVKEPAR
jgi:AcrR family transcriptional regulator